MIGIVRPAPNRASTAPPPASSWRWLALAALAAAGCATVGETTSPPPSRPVRIVELFVRDLRTASGRLERPVLARAADDLALELTGGGDRLPFDAWAELAAGGARVVGRPAAAPLARAVAERVFLAAGSESREPAASLPAPAPRGSAGPIVVVAPSWGPEGIDPSPVALARELADAGYPPARAWFVDLTSLRAGERSWAADVVAVADDAAGAELLARFVLGSRAAGRLEDWRSIAREIGLRPASVRWVRRAVIDRLRGRQGVPATGSAPSD